VREEAADGTLTFRFGAAADSAHVHAPAAALHTDALEAAANTAAAAPARRAAAAMAPSPTSSWGAKEATGNKNNPDADYLFELGNTDTNLNVTHGQNVNYIDGLFTG
jgi:hypothetical protein